MAAGAVALAAASGAIAAETTSSALATGWWRRGAIEIDGLPIGTRVDQPLVEVPPGAVYLENDPRGARAVAALRFDGSRGPARLTLEVADGAMIPLGALIVLCSISEAWTPATDGPWDQRPTADCEGAASGRFTADRTMIEFTIDELGEHLAGATVNLMLAPAANDRTTFAIALMTPTLTITQPSLPTTPSTPSSPEATTSSSLPAASLPTAAPSTPPITPPATFADDHPDSESAAPGLIAGYDLDGPARAAVAAVLALFAGLAYGGSSRRPQTKGPR